MCRWVAGASLARARDYRKMSGQERVGGEGTKLQPEHSPPASGGAAPFTAFSKDLVDNLLIDSQINCQYGQTKGAERAGDCPRFSLVIETSNRTSCSTTVDFREGSRHISRVPASCWGDSRRYLCQTENRGLYDASPGRDAMIFWESAPNLQKDISRLWLKVMRTFKPIQIVPLKPWNEWRLNCC